MKNNKKTILIAGGIGLLVVTLVAIANPFILASSNSDEQTIKDAQAALKKLTIDQKTVDLTKTTTQKLPTKFKITSMEDLNASLKEAITILDGITYMPQVTMADDIRGEIVIEIEIKKGVDNASVNFVVVGFTTINQVQADLEAALAKVGDNTISGDSTKLPWQMNPTLIKALAGFPKTTSNGVSFSVVPKSANKREGELGITLTVAKYGENTFKDITISGFQTQAQDNQITIDAYKELVSGKTITTTKVLNKLSSMVTYTDITDFNAKTNANLAQPDPSIDISITSQDNDGNKVVTFVIMKGTKRVTHNMVVTGFKIAT